MKNELVIWILGTHSSGKTSLSMKIHDFFRDTLVSKHDPNEYPKIIKKIYENDVENINCFFTLSSSVSAHVGKLDGKTQCGGTDTLNSKDLVSRSLKFALDERPIAIIDGAMATGTWIDFILSPKRELYLILLDVSIDGAVDRLRGRRAIKNGVRKEDIEILFKTRENLLRKKNTFSNMFDRLSAQSSFSQKINTEGKDADEVFQEFKDFFIKNVL